MQVSTFDLQYYKTLAVYIAAMPLIILFAHWLYANTFTDSTLPATLFGIALVVCAGVACGLHAGTIRPRTRKERKERDDNTLYTRVYIVFIGMIASMLICLTLLMAATAGNAHDLRPSRTAADVADRTAAASDHRAALLELALADGRITDAERAVLEEAAAP